MTRPKYHPHANDNRPQWFDALLLQYEPFLRKHTPDEETYQEASCRALEQWYRFKPDGHFPTWLNYIVRHIRYEQGKRQEAAPDIARTAPASQEDAMMVMQALEGDAGELAMTAVGFTGKEIAAAMGVCRKTVTSRLREARALLVAANDNDVAKAA